MKSAEVYATLNEHLTPAFQAAGFKRAQSMLSWARPQQDRHLIVWCQVSQDGWDTYAGSKFTVEFQLSKEPVVGAVSYAHRKRLPQMLDAAEREEVRGIQNEVIASLNYPPPHHPLLLITDLRSLYLKRFQKVDQPYAEKDDIWFRYSCPHHVRTWAGFIVAKLPGCLLQAESWR